mgnify:FL=1
MNKIIEQITSKINNLPKSTLQALIGAVVAAVIVVFAVVFFMGGPSTPQEQFKETIKTVVSTDKYLDKMASGFKFSNSKKELLKNHYKELFDDEMIDYLTKELDKKGLFANKKENKNQSLWLATSMQIFNALSLQGLRRLTPEDREKSMVFNRYLVKTLSPRDCKMFVNGDRRLFASTSFQSGSARAFEKMTDEEYAGYLSSLRNAFKAEIRDNPKRVEVTEGQKEKIQALLSDAIDEELNKQPAGLKARLQRAADDLDRANPVDACKFGRIIYDAAASITNPEDRDLVNKILLTD